MRRLLKIPLIGKARRETRTRAKIQESRYSLLNLCGFPGSAASAQIATLIQLTSLPFLIEPVLIENNVSFVKALRRSHDTTIFRSLPGSIFLNLVMD